MVAPTAIALKSALDDETYPYPIEIFTYVPKYSRYPYIVIRKTPPIQTEKDVTTKTIREGFEITLYIRYTKLQQDEEADQLTIENTILNSLEKIDFGTQALYLETKSWQRTPIPTLYGTQSRLSVMIVDKASITGEGILGSDTSMTLPSGDKVKILALNSTEGAVQDTHTDDVGINLRDFSQIEQGDFTMEYESAPTLNNEIKQISDGNNVDVTFIKKGVSRSLTVLFGLTSKRGQFDTIERASTRFTVQAETGTQIKVSQVSVDAILQ